MKITGGELLLAAAELVVSGKPGEELVGDLARRSRHVIDSSYLSPELLGERTGSYDVVLASGTDSVTWGTGGNVNELLPARIEYWSVVDPTGLERQVTPDGKLSTLEQWLNRSYIVDRGYPTMCYWQRDLDQLGRQIIRFAPEADQDYTIRFYAVIPPLDKIEIGKEYTLPQGVSDHLIALMAREAEALMAFPPSHDIAVKVSVTKRRLTSIGRPIRSRPINPGWLDLDGEHLRGFRVGTEL